MDVLRGCVCNGSDFRGSMHGLPVRMDADSNINCKVDLKAGFAFFFFFCTGLAHSLLAEQLT